jgi:ATP diphosphatase
MPSVLDGVTISLPALTRAAKIQARAARVGFDWPDAGPVFDKVREEMSELQSAMDAGANSDALLEEIGDLLFAVVNLARHLGLDAEGALRAATRKFERRFHRVEALLSEAGIEPAEASLDRMETAWTQAKSEEDQEI